MLPGDPDDEFDDVLDGDDNEQGTGSQQEENLQDDRDEEYDGPGEQETEGEIDEGSEDGARHDEGEDGQGGPDDVDPRAELNSRSRRSRSRWQKLEAQRRELEQRARDAEEKLRNTEELQRRREEEQRLQRQRIEEEELARLTPEERQQHRIDKLERQFELDRQMSAFRTADAEDKATFKGFINQHPVIAKHEEVVETYLKQMRGRGTNMPRGVVLRYVLGDMALKELEKSKKPLAPVKSQKAPKSSNSRGDVQRPQARRGPTSERAKLYERLKDVPL